MAIKVTCEVENYDEPKKENLLIHTASTTKIHCGSRVVLEIDNKIYTFLAKDLIAAIQNCQNT